MNAVLGSSFNCGLIKSIMPFSPLRIALLIEQNEKKRQRERKCRQGMSAAARECETIGHKELKEHARHFIDDEADESDGETDEKASTEAGYADAVTSLLHRDSSGSAFLQPCDHCTRLMKITSR